jgi:catechol 2,3-dioxygenase-like lactoylglutathione lyase family enzyme
MAGIADAADEFKCPSALKSARLQDDKKRTKALRNQKDTIDMANPTFSAIDHVQLAMPAGKEDEARRFYVGLLGMIEIEKPAELKKRGGCWFQSGSVQLHLGVENDFRPARKAHPALRCVDYDRLTARLSSAGHEVVSDPSIPGVRRCHISDPFGNRIELIQP